MKKISLLVSLCVFLVGISALGQQIGGNPVLQPQQMISIEDDANGNYLLFSPTTGAYKFNRCGEGVILSGKGLVKIDGCNIALEDVQDNLRVVASVNQCDKQGKASIERVASFTPAIDIRPISEVLSDSNMRNNTLTCTDKK